MSKAVPSCHRLAYHTAGAQALRPGGIRQGRGERICQGQEEASCTAETSGTAVLALKNIMSDKEMEQALNDAGLLD